MYRDLKIGPRGQCRVAFCNVIIYLLSASPVLDEARRTKRRKRDGVTMGNDKHLDATERAECGVDHRMTRRRWLLSFRPRSTSSTFSTDVSTPIVDERARSLRHRSRYRANASPLSHKSGPFVPMGWDGIVIVDENGFLLQFFFVTCYNCCNTYNTRVYKSWYIYLARNKFCSFGESFLSVTSYAFLRVCLTDWGPTFMDPSILN